MASSAASAAQLSPSSSPSHSPTRTLLHSRRIHCEGFARDDGLYDIEARMQDISPDGTDMLFKSLGAGDDIHHMRIVMTVDAKLVIQSITAHTLAGPTPECERVASFYSALIGVQIGRGFRKKVQELLGGVKGCTHMTELLNPLATTAMQTMFAVQRASGVFQQALAAEGPMDAPPMVGTCHTYRLDGEATKRIWPLHRRG